MKIETLESLSAHQREDAARILTEALAHMPSAYDLDEAREQVARFDGRDAWGFAAVERGAVLGWVGALPNYSHAWELHPLAVDPAHQRRGIGLALVGHLEAFVAALGAITLYLGTDDDFGGTNLYGVELFPDPLAKLAAIAPADGHPYLFYKRAGFAVVGIIPDANGPGCPDIFMAKKL